MKNAPQFAEHFHFLCRLCFGLLCESLENKPPKVVQKRIIVHQSGLKPSKLPMNREVADKKITIIQPKEIPQGINRSFKFLPNKKPQINEVKTVVALVAMLTYLKGS